LLIYKLNIFQWKAYENNDKYSRRYRYNGPLMDFHERDRFKPNV
jgi:hypothetical protein